MTLHNTKEQILCVHLLILVVLLTIYGSLWELTGRDTSLMKLQGFMLLVINKEEDEYFKQTASSFISS